MPEILYKLPVLLTIIATGAMAASASIQAARYNFDAFGAMVLAVATAMGGGTLRDILLGNTPVFWMTDMTYLATAIPIALITFVLAKMLNAGAGQRWRLLMYFDAIGLALFTIAGIQASLIAGSPAPVAIIMGCITGTFGGLIRDLLCNLTPTVLKEDLYATISLVGGAIFLLLKDILPSETIAIWSSFGAMFILRCVVIARSKG